MSLSYMWEVFYSGTSGLAAGAGCIQQRLENTFGSYLAPRLGGPNMDLPKELSEKVEDIMRRVTCVRAIGDEGTVAATCRVMSDEEAKKIAEEIVSIFSEVCILYGREQEQYEATR